MAGRAFDVRYLSGTSPVARHGGVCGSCGFEVIMDQQKISNNRECIVLKGSEERLN